MSNFNSYNVNLHILSPIHIGSGQELDPFSYVIREGKLLFFDLLKWMDGYSKKEELQEKMNSEDFIELRTYISEKFDNESAILGSVPIKSPSVISTYHKAIKDKNSENQAIVNFMTRNEITRTTYIPGSSIKGAIRTAIANRFVAAAGVTKNNKRKIHKPRFEPDYNEKIFGKPLNDPMKNLKIADVSLNAAGSVIYEAKEHSNKSDKTPKGVFEASSSLCELDTPVIISLHFSLKNFVLLEKNVDLQFIIDALYDFYMPKLKEEYAKFYCGAGTKEIQQAIAPLYLEAINLKSNETLIRIGRFSHVECVTLDHVRDPQTRWKDGKPLPWGKTRTLANGLLPFGWAKLEFTDLSAIPREEKDWPFSIQEIKNNVEIKREAMLKAEKERLLAEKLRQEMEHQRLAEEKRQAELASMAPEDRMIVEVNDPLVTENRVVEIYTTIDIFPEDKKSLLATALKSYWQRANKWKKKKCSAKQWEKVQKIKKVLGED